MHIRAEISFVRGCGTLIGGSALEVSSSDFQPTLTTARDMSK